MAESLSTRRIQIRDVIVPQVVPSSYGDAKFKNIDSKWQPGAGYTTCGGLPAYVATQLGLTPDLIAEGIAGSGLASLRDAAMKRGAWVHHDITLRSLAGGMNMEGEMRRPKTGDFYMLCSGDVGRHKMYCNKPLPKNMNNYIGGAIEHVGIIIKAEGNLWKTADAGQPNGNVQAALYCDRTFNPVTGDLVGEYDKKGNRPMRRLCGWCDVDKYPFLKFRS